MKTGDCADGWIFIHVMKTAGTSFRKMLEKQLGAAVYPTREELKQHKRGWYLKARELRERLQSGELTLGGRQVVCGHFSASVAERMPGDWRLAVFLRDPVARSLSMIAHRLKHDGPENLLGHPEAAGDAVLKLLEDEKFVNSQVRDYQTKVLSMKPMANVNSPMLVGEREYETAVRRLESIDFVGITEQFSESISLFESVSGIRFSVPLLQRNRSPLIAPTDAAIEKIRNLVGYDQRLYECALERFGKEASGDLQRLHAGGR
ncbi:hypothetical protein [Wenzhouxiangella sp. EGI_FJ10305]|uniref:hypothetical protein n=1 Tax=Wenzhouxiangella sp. EGI_FJ10305 TaxID=3243768 RepID=UPI0035E06ADB